MKDQVNGKTYHIITTTTGLMAIGALVELHIVSWLWYPSRFSFINWSVCCYLAIICAGISITFKFLARRERAVSPFLTGASAVAFTLAIVTIPLILIMEQMRVEYGNITCERQCRSVQEQAYIEVEKAEKIPNLISVESGRLLSCCIYEQYPPWFPPTYKTAGINIHVVEKRLDTIPHPERTVLFADCIPPDGRITGPEDIDWNRHGKDGCNILLCCGIRWDRHQFRRDELIFDPWPEE